MQSAKLAKLLRMVTEFRYRLARNASNPGDANNTVCLQKKICNSIRDLQVCKWWLDILFHDDKHALHLQKELQGLISKAITKEKSKRISAWKHRMTQAMQIQSAKDVFSWVRNKTTTKSPNVVKDVDGNILYSPQEAIREVNETWDEVFAANIIHEDPTKVLEFIWPFISDISQPTTLPPLTGSDLKKHVSKRRKNAAGGLDGWKTEEVQCLPTFVFDLIADFFAQVENGKRSLPSSLCTSKQVALPKPGPDCPLNKRLITIMPIFMLTYTGLRYAQLQPWQNKVMPPQVFGGIKGRRMSHVQHSIRLHLDMAKTNTDPIIGAKLDKSKCFDRLIPSLSIAILTGLGVPSGVLIVFGQLYSSLKRHLGFLQWTSPTPTTAPNGVVQGCSLSLLAVNAMMAGWSKLMERIPHLSFASFIDDSYIWSSKRNSDALQTALEATALWDQLTGQKMNNSKCEMWASNVSSRKSAKSMFPGMKHVSMVEVLGARL